MKRLGQAGAVRGSRNARARAKRPTRRFSVTLKFDLGGLGALGHQTFVRYADSRADGRRLVGRVRTGSLRVGSRIIPGARLLYATVKDERPC